MDPEAQDESIVVRLARAEELDRLRDIERAAGVLFRDIGMDAVADDEPASIDELLAFQRDGRAWVAADDHDAPIAYLLFEQVDGQGHIEQVSIDPAHARRGLGRRLIEAAGASARLAGCTALTLTTYADVPWNGPYYRRLGFLPMDEGELTPGLQLICADEAARGLDAWPRIAMRRPLG